MFERISRKFRNYRFSKKYADIIDHPSRMRCTTDTALDLHSDAKISLQGLLDLNLKWSPIDPSFSLLFMGMDARLEVRDDFQIYSDAKNFINEGASLSIGSG